MIYKICKNCVMDTSDPNIKFDELEECDYCENYNNNILPEWNFAKGRELELSNIISSIKKEGEGKDFDCILGLSGGLDSAYLAHIAVKEFGLRPLLFHVDVGWNTEQSVSNIEKIVNGLYVDLYTEVIDWEEMKDLQRSFFMSQIPDQDYPQDIAYISMLYKFARKYKIKYILNGGNFSTECCREPEEWGGYLGVDTWLVGDIQKKFGRLKLKNFPLVDILNYKFFYKYFFGIRSEYLLNYVPYTRELAEDTLMKLYGCKKFQHKHHESRFTRFYEDYWLPKKFGFEKRRAHFSSLIMTGQMSREEAINRLSKSELSEEFLAKEFQYVADKLDFTVEEFRIIFSAPNKTYRSYRNKKGLIFLGAKILRILGLEKRLFR
ncbi:N-acetyl sugar amidotransferase [Cyclobacteriaceae bacterium]|nr:N-acetyl sugar amidotransferase [Cyclobacteriaceae bacterium]